MPESPDNTDRHDGPKSPEKRKTLRTLGALGVVLLIGGVRECFSEKPEASESAEEPKKKPSLKKKSESKEVRRSGYFGTWKYSNDEKHITFSSTEHQPKKELVIDGHELKLLIPASVRIFYKYQYSKNQSEVHSAPGGIYRMDGKQDVFIGSAAPHFRSSTIGLVRNNYQQIVVTDEQLEYFHPESWTWNTLNRVSK